MSLFVETDDFITTEINKAKKFECFKCKLVSHKNYCIECGHCICEQCIKNNNKCLIDDKEIIEKGNAFQFSFTYLMLKDLKLKCHFNSKGCSWEDKYEKYVKYHFNECEYKKDINSFSQLNSCKIENNIATDDPEITKSPTCNCPTVVQDNNIKNDKNSDSNFKEENTVLDNFDDCQNDDDLNSENSYELNMIKNSHEIYDYSVSNSELNIKESDNLKNETETENSKLINDDDIPIAPFKNEAYEEHLASSIIEIKEFESIIIQNNNASKSNPFKYICPQELFIGFECQIMIKGKSGKNISIGTFSDNNKNYQELLSLKKDPEFFEIDNIIKIEYTKNNFMIKDNRYKKSVTRNLYENDKYFLYVILKNKGDIIELKF